MGKFGWSYPPGAGDDSMAPYNQDDPPCGVCGKDPYGGPGGCECLPCVRCEIVGVPLNERMCEKCWHDIAVTE